MSEESKPEDTTEDASDPDRSETATRSSLAKRFFGYVQGVIGVLTLVGILAGGVATFLIFQEKIGRLESSNTMLIQEIAALKLAQSDTDGRMNINSAAIDKIPDFIKRIDATEGVVNYHEEQISKLNGDIVESYNEILGQIQVVKDYNFNTSVALDEFCEKTRDFAKDINDISRSLLDIEKAYSRVLEESNEQEGITDSPFSDRFLGELGQLITVVNRSFDEIDQKYRSGNTVITVCKPQFLSSTVAPAPVPK